MNNKAYATLRRIGNQAVVYEACFLSNVQATHTIHFVSSNGVHAYIDVSEGDPVALTLIHKPSVKINYQEVPPGTKIDLKTPYKLAIKLIVLDSELLELVQDAQNAHATQAQMAFRGRLIDSETKELSFAGAEPECTPA